MYVYKWDAGNRTPEPHPPETATKKAVLRGWGLRRSKTYRENDHLRPPEKAEDGGGDCQVIQQARKSVSYDGRKSVSQVEADVGSAAAFLQVKVLAADMPGLMQVHAFRCARRTYDSLEKFSSKHMAFTMKKEFDKVYGPAWHCIVGSSFGSFVTHSTGGFLYFSMDKLYILVFKTKIQKALH